MQSPQLVARQVGKTTIALEAAQSLPTIDFDLKSEPHRVKLEQSELRLTDHLDELAIIDEVRRAPGGLPTLRGPIDPALRGEKRAGQCLAKPLLVIK